MRKLLVSGAIALLAVIGVSACKPAPSTDADKPSAVDEVTVEGRVTCRESAHVVQFLQVKVLDHPSYIPLGVVDRIGMNSVHYTFTLARNDRYAVYVACASPDTTKLGLSASEYVTADGTSALPALFCDSQLDAVQVGKCSSKP